MSQHQTQVHESVTESATLAVPYARAFAFLADPVNQPRWAVNFVKEVRPTADGFEATTVMGRCALEVRADRATGVIDLRYGDDVYQTRLVRNGSGCEYQFTLIRPPQMPDAAWSAGVAGLREELEGLRALLCKEAAA